MKNRLFVIALSLVLMLTMMPIYLISQIDLQWISHEAIIWIIVFLFLFRIQFEHPYGRLGTLQTLFAKKPIFGPFANGFANKLFLSDYN